jgi:hypothetical protein
VFGFGIVYGPDISSLLFGDLMLLTTLNPKFRDKEGADTDDFAAAIAIDFYGDSGHTTWSPSMTKTAKTESPAAAEETTAAADPTAGFVRTNELKIVDGELLQKWDAFHIGADAKWLAVPVENSSDEVEEDEPAKDA